MTNATSISGMPSAAQQIKNTLALRKVLFGNSLLVDTNSAAASIGRAPSTLRKWAMRGDGPLKPIRADGGLLWRVSDLMKLSGEGEV